MSLLTTFFFVPANNPRFIAKSESLVGVDHRVFDLEDAITPDSLQESVRNLLNRTVDRADWIRISVDSQFVATIDLLSDAGYRNFVLPKLADESELEQALDRLDRRVPQAGVIVLVENPRFYVQLPWILDRFASRMHGIGLGSHDFAASTRMKHDLDLLQPIRLNVAVLARAYDLEPIDVASMQIRDTVSFESDLRSGFDMGYRAKFLLHPSQLDTVRSFSYYTLEEVRHAAHVLEKMDSNALEQKAVALVDGRIYEKPHIERLKEMHHWGIKHYGTDR